MTPECAKRVAQILNLLDRRVVLGGSTGVSRRWGTSTWPQNAILRYSAARRSRNPSSAELHSAVSPICNRRAVRRDPPADTFEPSAEYNSAIQQITNLRYEKSSRRATTWTDTGRVQLCATSSSAKRMLLSTLLRRYCAAVFPTGRNPRLERTAFELRSTGVKPEATNPLRSGIHTRGYLPHVKREGARYFITFRLADSLPKEVLLKHQGERAERLTSFYAQQDAAKKFGAAAPKTSALAELERDYRRQIERYLDHGCGKCWLRQPQIAQLVTDAIQHFERERYHLHAWV